MAVPLTQQLNPLNRRVQAQPKPHGLVNNIALIVDNSGSMSHIRDRALEAFNEQISAISTGAFDAKDQKTHVWVYKFGQFITPLRANVFASSLIPLQASEYSANESHTKLNDAVRKAIEDLSAADDGHQDTSSLVIVVTDGEENASVKGRVDQLIRDKQSTDRWTFAFLGPRGSSRRLQSWGVPAGNIQEWDQTEQGVREMAKVTNDSVFNYYSDRSAGLTSTRNFITNLDNVKPSQVAALPDLTPQFKALKVDKEAAIADFVRDRGLHFEIGRGFYELTKPEKIADHKKILIQDRATKKLHGGDDARKLLGIQSGPGVLVKVTPGNHANYKVFINSTAPNRKLVRGTDLMYKVA